MNLMEQPVLILVSGTILVSVFVGGLVQTGRRSLLYLAIAAAFATGGLLLLERMTITPREEVRATLYVIAHHLEQDDVDAVLGFISDGKPKLKREAKQKMGLVEIGEVDIKRNLRVKIVEARGIQVAEARFNCVIHFDRIKGFSEMSNVSRRYPQFFVVRFRQDDDGCWRVRDYEMQDPRNGIGS